MGECVYLNSCPMFERLRFDATKQIFISQYCKGDYEKCERKKLRDAGKEVPPTLLPNGEHLK